MTQLLIRVRIRHSFGQKKPQQANSSPNTVIAVGLFHNFSAEIQGLYPKTTIYAKIAFLKEGS
jgi:hypothetical protein